MSSLFSDRRISSNFDFQRKWKFSTLLNNNDINSEVQNHLSKVYLTLTGACFSSLVGVIAYARFHFGNLITFIASFLCLFLIRSNQPPEKKIKYMILFGFLQGLSIAPLCKLAFLVDPSIISSAFISSTAIFVCFSLSALISKRRSFLYLSSLTSSCIFILLVVSIFSPSFSLIFGLFIFSLYIIIDTQMIIERGIILLYFILVANYLQASLGSLDYVRDSSELFIDLVAIFIRIIAILLKKRREKRKD